MPENRLASESSPYLLQHAHNPVDWYPWGPEALALARERRVPIFLSIGYATCYWCHVMERESFEDAGVARFLNQHFVPVKVDREQRPDIDDLYMAATQLSTGHGGWPMSVFLEPDGLRPFYCGTYFPPEPRHELPSFAQVLEGLANAWAQDSDRVIAAAENLAETVSAQLSAASKPVAIGEEQVSQAVSILLRIHDQTAGGFGRAPKFPQPAYAEFLLDARAGADDTTAAAIDLAVRATLDAMMIGGLCDHLAGGFHRYAVDANWTVPHFEKMLYDNAGLGALYARAAMVYDDPLYKRTAERTFAYVDREMTDPAGTHYSAQDAEVNHREGLSYLWNEAQIREALPTDDADFAIRAFGIDRGANFQDPHHPSDPPANVLRLDARHDEVARRMNTTTDAFLERLDRVSGALLEARDKREQPRLDDKSVSAWSAMMIAAMARAARDLNKPELLGSAARSADALLEHARSEEHGLLRVCRGGRAHTPAFLEDFANLADALLAIARASDDDHAERSRRIEQAGELLDAAFGFFADPDSGKVYDTRADQGDLFVRAATTYDGATPSGRSVLLHALIDHAELARDDRSRDRAVELLIATSAAISESPVSTVHATRALLRAMRAGLPLAERIEALALPAPETAREQPSPVKVFASQERVSLNADTPASLSVRLEIDKPYHIVAANPGPGGARLLPFRVSIAGGSGVRVYADYPEGTPFRVEGFDDALSVYSGQIDFDIALEREGKLAGRPLLVVSFVACSEQECLLPSTLELDVAIDVAVDANDP